MCESKENCSSKRSTNIKKIEAIIKPAKLEEVGEALASLGFESMTMTEVKGFGRQWGRTEIYLGSEYSLDFVPKIKIEMVVADREVEAAVAAVIGSARTGKIGDGKIFVSPIEQAGLLRKQPEKERAI